MAVDERRAWMIWALGISTCEFWESWRCAPRWADARRVRKTSHLLTSRRSPFKDTPASNWRSRLNPSQRGPPRCQGCKIVSAPKTNGRPRQRLSFSGPRLERQRLAALRNASSKVRSPAGIYEPAVVADIVSDRTIGNGCSVAALMGDLKRHRLLLTFESLHNK